MEWGGFILCIVHSEPPTLLVMLLLSGAGVISWFKKVSIESQTELIPLPQGMVEKFRVHVHRSPYEWNRLFCSLVNYSIIQLHLLKKGVWPQVFPIEIVMVVRKLGKSKCWIQAKKKSDLFSWHCTAGWVCNSYCTAHILVIAAWQHKHALFNIS